MVNAMSYWRKKDKVVEVLRKLTEGTPLQDSWFLNEILAGAVTDALIAKNRQKNITQFTTDFSTAGEILDHFDMLKKLVELDTIEFPSMLNAILDNPEFHKPGAHGILYWLAHFAYKGEVAVPNYTLGHLFRTILNNPKITSLLDYK